MGFGKPKYGNSNFKTVRTVKDGESLRFRVLPPMFSLEKKGLWSQQHKQHFGYSVPSRNDPAKLFPRPFYCIERIDFRTKAVLEHCPECDKIKLEKDRLASAKDTLKKKGLPEDKIKEAVKPLNDWLSKHNVDNKIYLNVKFVDGSYGTVKVAWSVKKDIDKLVLSLTKPEPGRETIDPIDPDGGVWFEVSRSGKGFNTEYSTKIVTEPLSVEIPGRGKIVVEEIKKAPLSEEDYNKASEVCYDLVDVGIPLLSSDRIAMLVNGSGSVEEVEAVFGAPEREESPRPEPHVESETSKSGPVAATSPQADVDLVVATTQSRNAPVAMSGPSTTIDPITEPGIASDDPTEWTEEQFNQIFGPKP